MKFRDRITGKKAVQSSGFNGKVIRKVFKGAVKQNKPVERS